MKNGLMVQAVAVRKGKRDSSRIARAERSSRPGGWGPAAEELSVR